MQTKIVSLVALVVFANLFFFHSFTPVMFVCLTAGFVLFLLAMYVRSKAWQRQATFLPWFVLFLLIEWWVLLWRNANAVLAVAVLSVVGAIVLLSYLLASGLPRFRSLMEVGLSPVRTGWAYINGIVLSLNYFASTMLRAGQSRNKSKLSLGALAMGLIISFPVLAVLISLLQSADPVYAEWMQHLFNFNLSFPTRVWQRLVMTLLLTAFLWPWLFTKVNKKFNLTLVHAYKPTVVQSLMVLQVLVIATLASFLVVQAPYVFARVAEETDLSRFGVATYSEYVTKGFSELLLVSVVIYGVVWVGLSVLRGVEVSYQRWPRLLQLILLAVFGIFVLSILRRLGLYVQFHGLSLIRFYGLAFLIWVCGMTLFLAMRHFRERRWVTFELAFSAGLLVLLSLFNAEGLIANHYPPTVNHRVDYVYLSRMSADGVAGWEKAFDHAAEVLNRQTYLDDGVIDREERREIAYAGLVLKNISDDYSHLALDYASPEELRPLMLTSSEANLVYIDRLYQQSLASLPDKADPNFSFRYQQLSNLNSTRSGIQSFHKELQSLDAKAPNPYSLVLYTDFYTYPFNECTDLFCLPLFSYLVKMSPEWAELRAGQQGWFDRMLKYNRSKLWAWNNFFTEARVKEMESLQRRYQELYLLILRQPTNQRDFERDISLNSPLL